MNKLHRIYVVLIVAQLALPGIGAICSGQVRDTSLGEASENNYAIQVAASKVYIDPEFFRHKYNLTEDIRYFLKDGWYKYVIGSYKTEAEANTRLAGLKFDAFVTSIAGKGVSKDTLVRHQDRHPSSDSLMESKANSADTSQLSPAEFNKPAVNETDMRRLYNFKIREADSAFNLAKNLLVARQLYLEASLIEEDKNYPKDQIIEIDKLLTQKQPHSIFSKLNVEFYILSGFAIILLLVLGTLLIIRSGNQKRMQSEREGKEEIQEPVTGELSELIPIHQISSPSEKSNESGHEPEDLLNKLNSSDVFLRMEAELALIRMDVKDPFSFLDHVKQEFSSLEQLVIFEKIKTGQLTIPDFSRWLNSPNPSVIKFCRWMIKVYKQDS